MIRNYPIIIALLFPLWTGGCGEGGSGDALVELGTGTVDYEPITEDQELPLHQGPQGGHHFFLHVRMRGLAGGDPTTTMSDANPYTSFNIFDEDGEVVDRGTSVYRLGYREVDGWYELPSGRIVEIREALVDRLIDRRVRLRVQIADNSGAMATDLVWVHAYEVPLFPDADAGTPDAGEPDAGPGNLGP